MFLFSGMDKTADVEVECKEVLVKPTDYCLYYKKHPYTVLCRKECWTCNYSDFGIETGVPLEIGVCMCRFKEH